jgi:hypothetical protein
MKNLIFSILVLSTIACQKQEVDCDQVHSKCRLIQFSFSNCSPQGGEYGWKWDIVRSDTTDFFAVGCPHLLNAEFIQQQEKTYNDSNTPIALKKFMQAYPSTCNCQ